MKVNLTGAAMFEKFYITKPFRVGFNLTKLYFFSPVGNVYKIGPVLQLAPKKVPFCTLKIRNKAYEDILRRVSSTLFLFS